MHYVITILLMLIPMMAIALGLLFAWDKLPKCYFGLLFLVLVGCFLVLCFNKTWLLVGSIFILPLFILITAAIGLCYAWKKMPRLYFWWLLGFVPIVVIFLDYESGNYALPIYAVFAFLLLIPLIIFGAFRVAWKKLPRRYFWLLIFFVIAISSLAFSFNTTVFIAIILCFLLLCILIAIIFGLVFAWKKMPRHYFFLSIVMIAVSPFLIYKLYERKYTLSYVPDALEVSSISYDKEETWGFGPGGNEAGIVVYPLPEQVANQISQRGIAFLNNLPNNRDQQSRDWRGDFGQWFPTPIVSDKQNWSGTTGNLNIYDYICAYGFCIDIDKAVEQQATEIVNSKGSYYAYGRIGLIVVSPQRKVVLFMFNG